MRYMDNLMGLLKVQLGVVFLGLSVFQAFAQTSETVDRSVVDELNNFKFKVLSVPSQRISQRIDIQISRCEEDYSIDGMSFFSKDENEEYELNEHPIFSSEILPVFQEKYSFFENYVGSTNIDLYKEPRVFIPEALVVIRKVFLVTYSFYDPTKKVSSESKYYVGRAIGDLVNVSPGLGSKFSLSCKMLTLEENENDVIEQLTVPKSGGQFFTDLFSGNLNVNNTGVDAYNELIKACDLGTKALNQIRVMTRLMRYESLLNN